MRLPSPNAHYSHRVRFGRYVTRRLRQSKFESLATDTQAVSGELKQTGRAVEDAQDAIQDFMADRDGSDADIDFAVQSARNEMAGRSLDAVRTEPYKSIFDKGIAYYIAAPLGEENARYGELVSRLESNLPATDPLRIPTVKAIVDGLEVFNAAVRGLEAARANASMLNTKLDAGIEAWDRQMEKVYGALVVEVGRTRAETFFPRLNARRPAPEGAVDVPNP